MIASEFVDETAPDYLEPLVAWRLWDVRTVEGETRLQSVYRVCVWPVRTALVAECGANRIRLWPRRGRHPAPVESCRCGIYGTDCDHLRTLLSEGPHETDRFPVVGTVFLWGRVLECEHGWRASHAYPERLLVPGWSAHAELVARRLEVYGVPVEVAGGTLADALVELAARA